MDDGGSASGHNALNAVTRNSAEGDTMRMLIIGCGYVGARVGRLWRQEHHDVHVLTRSVEHAGTFRSRGWYPVVGNVVNRDSLRPLGQLGPIDCLLYAVGFDRHGAHDKRTVYVDGLRNVLKSVVHNVRRVVYVSSTSVYGQTDGGWVDEQTPCTPSTPGGLICRDAEQTLWSICGVGAGEAARQRPTARILRMAGLYGPHRLLRRVQAVRAGDPLGGNEDGYLNLIHADDAAGAIVACAAHWPASPVYNVADGHPLTRHEYYSILAELVGGPPPTFTAQDDSSRHRNAGTNKRVNSDRIRQELPEWAPRYPHARVGLAHALATEC